MKTDPTYFDADLYKVLSETFPQERELDAVAEILVEKYLTTLARLRRESRATLEFYGMPPGLAGDIIEAIEKSQKPPVSPPPPKPMVWDTKNLMQFREILLACLLEQMSLGCFPF